jgi:hypothetical protein
MEEGQVDEDLASRFIDYLEDQEMDDAASASSIQALPDGEIETKMKITE